MATAMEVFKESERSSSSNSSSQESASEDEILEQSSLIVPYSNEPLASSGDEFDESTTDDEDGISSETLGKRWSKDVPVNSWCQCGRCNDRHLSSAREYRCCKEILECAGKYTYEGKDAACIVEHWDYLPMVHRTVLSNVGQLLTRKDGTKYKERKTRVKTSGKIFK
ncbi:uncharacterized protein LOC114544255 [Dendronephthya gigantea]|uniref:uncharacterized protein LOC114544255 n=1 Tax=Dendronephthya gigantea TaxID=151771 RepID=UPI00106D6AFB|nr:uncharacterized protein LOC114544255 [Dendronephthya gigantea]